MLQIGKILIMLVFVLNLSKSTKMRVLEIKPIVEGIDSPEKYLFFLPQCSKTLTILNKL